MATTEAAHCTASSGRYNTNRMRIGSASVWVALAALLAVTLVAPVASFQHQRTISQRRAALQNHHLLRPAPPPLHSSSTSSTAGVRKYLQQQQQQPHATTTQLRGLSLDDNWDELANLITTSARKASSSLDWSSFAKKTTQDLHWNQAFSKEWFAVLQTAFTDLGILFAALPWWTEAAIVLLPLSALLTGTLYSISQPQPGYRDGREPYPRGNYDPVAAQAYYSRHKFLVLQRALQVFRLSNKFLINLALDKYVWRNEEAKRPQRAQELLDLVVSIGCTGIKIGQALSVRPDLIPNEYAHALSTLQDQVPPFENAVAKDLMRRELGQEKFAKLGLDGPSSKKPVASASIGQVYKGLLQDGGGPLAQKNKAVAIKVQRPNVLAEIALDLYLVRELAPIYQRFTGGATDLQSLANEWGRGFIAELDYRAEADATMRFNRAMQERQLYAVCAPHVLSEYSTETVLVTEWVDGTRLDESDAADVPRLCAVALNAYLVMLLELQSLHCDPHPGNLLRTSDGRLCILDFGMTLDIAPNLQYSLLSYVAHLTSEDYDQLPEDLVALGFLKPEKLDFARRSGALEPLKYFLKQAGQGGGANGVRDRIFEEYREKYPGLTDDELRVEMRSEMKQQMADIVERESVATGITVEVEELQKQNRDSFQIPEWFLYGSRAFLTLEGVSLAADPNYSLIQSCFPYVAKRLVGDDDPRARTALRDLIYGATDSVDVKRLTDLADGFTSYTTTTKTINQQATSHRGEVILTSGNVEKVSKDTERKNKMVEAEATITLAKDSADILLNPDGNLVQNLLVEESALAASARFKDTVRERLVDGPQQFRDSLPFGVGSLFPPLPFEEQLAPFVRKTEKEIKAQQLAMKIADFFTPQAGHDTVRVGVERGINPEATLAVVETLRELEPEQAALVLKEIRENLPKYAPLLGQLGSKFTATLLNTASKNIDTTLTELELAGESPNEAFRETVKGLSSAAQRSASAIAPKYTTTDAAR